MTPLDWSDADGRHLRDDYPDHALAWFLHRDLHRLDGPAVIYADGAEKWFVHGREITSAVAEMIALHDLPHWTEWDVKTWVLFRLFCLS